MDGQNIPPVTNTPQQPSYNEQVFKAASGSNGLAVTALVLGILSFLCFPLGIVAIIFGICGIIRAGKVNKGMGMAITGLILGFLLILIAPSILLPSLNHARSLARAAMSATQLNGIGKAVMLYREMNNDEMPADVGLLVEDGMISPKALVHPASKSTVQVINGRVVGEPSYVFFLDFPKKAPGSMIMAYEKPEFELKGKVFVLTYGGAVKKMDIDALNAQLRAEGRQPAE